MKTGKKIKAVLSEGGPGDDKKKKEKKQNVRIVPGMRVDNEGRSDNITKRGTLTSKRRGVGTASTSTESSNSTSGLKKTKTKKAPKAKKTKIEKITERAKRRGHNPDYYVKKYTDKQKEKARKKAAKDKQKADFDALSPEEKKQARENTRKKKSGKIRNKIMPVLRKIGLAKRSAQVTSKSSSKKTRGPKDNKGKAMSGKDVRQCRIKDDC